MTQGKWRTGDGAALSHGSRRSYQLSTRREFLTSTALSQPVNTTQGMHDVHYCRVMQSHAREWTLAAKPCVSLLCHVFFLQPTQLPLLFAAAPGVMMLLHSSKSPGPTQRASEPDTTGLQHLQRPSGQHGQATAPARAPAGPMHKACMHGTAGTHTTADPAKVGRYTCVCVCVCVHVQKQTQSDMWCGRTRMHAYVGVCVYLQYHACPPYMCCVCVCVCVCLHVKKQTHSDVWCGRTRTHAYVDVYVYLQVRACPPYMCCSPGAHWLPDAVCRASHVRWAGWVQCSAVPCFSNFPLLNAAAAWPVLCIARLQTN